LFSTASPLFHFPHRSHLSLFLPVAHSCTKNWGAPPRNTRPSIMNRNSLRFPPPWGL
jgi:hypothetical protein